MVLIRKKVKESHEEKEARRQQEEAQRAGIQDEYQAKGFELVSFVQANKGAVSLAIAGMVVAGALYSGFLYFKARKADKASLLVMTALASLEENQTKETKEKALKELTDIAATHKNSGVSALANLRAGELALSLNQAEEALQRYEAVLSEISTKDTFYPLAVIGKGYALEANNKGSESLKEFETIINANASLGRELSLYEAQRIATSLNDNEKGEKYRAMLNEEFPKSPYLNKKPSFGNF